MPDFTAEKSVQNSEVYWNGGNVLTLETWLCNNGCVTQSKTNNINKGEVELSMAIFLIQYSTCSSNANHASGSETAFGQNPSYTVREVHLIVPRRDSGKRLLTVRGFQNIPPVTTIITRFPPPSFFTAFLRDAGMLLLLRSVFLSRTTATEKKNLILFNFLF